MKPLYWVVLVVFVGLGLVGTVFILSQAPAETDGNNTVTTVDTQTPTETPTKTDTVTETPNDTDTPTKTPEPTVETTTIDYSDSSSGSSDESRPIVSGETAGNSTVN